MLCFLCLKSRSNGIDVKKKHLDKVNFAVSVC